MMNRFKFANKILSSHSEKKLHQFSKAIKQVKNIKKSAINSNIESISNAGWIYETALLMHKNYIKTFNTLKNHKYYDAWCMLENIEIGISVLKKNNSLIDLEESGICWIERIIEQWQTLYPYKLFLSPGMIIGYKICSICGAVVKLRNGCGHKKQMLYNGEICYHTAHDITLLETSVVKRPVQKYSVLNHENSDYTNVQHVVDRIIKPYDNWNLDLTKKLFPRERFSSVLESDQCPCNSGKDFKLCCINKESILIPHMEIGFDRKINKDLINNIFPY